MGAGKDKNNIIGDRSAMTKKKRGHPGEVVTEDSNEKQESML